MTRILLVALLDPPPVQPAAVAARCRVSVGGGGVAGQQDAGALADPLSLRGGDDGAAVHGHRDS